MAIGGGHGLANTLKAARRYAGRITAIVATADDGGSSGRLRETLGIHPPGDLRRCISALADPDSPWATALEHRFEGGELDGHALGNLMIAGLVETGREIVDAVDEVARIAGAAGRVLPATREPVVLKAYAGDGEVTGQVAIEHAGAISRIELVPSDPRAPAEAVTAIAEADQVVLGPGSLYGSVLAAAIVPEITQALADTRATRVYVCNLRARIPETEGYTAGDHVSALVDHGIRVEYMLCHMDALAAPGEVPDGVRTMVNWVARADGLAHDPERLAAALSRLVG